MFQQLDSRMQQNAGTSSWSRFQIKEVRCTCSYLELYNEELRDLLVPDRDDGSVPLREDCHGNVFAMGATEIPISSARGSIGEHLKIFDIQ
jgi:hypothetical protein